MTAPYGLNGFKRGSFQSGGPDLHQPLMGTPGDLWVTTDGDHNVFLAVAAPDGGVPGQSASQDAQTPRIFQRGSITVRVGPSSQLPSSATVGAILIVTDTRVALLGTGPGQPLLRVNLDVNKILASGLATGQFSPNDAVLGPPPAGQQVPISLFDING